jgi:hypothetical protein
MSVSSGLNVGGFNANVNAQQINFSDGTVQTTAAFGGGGSQFFAASTKWLFVDNGRTDAYTADGTILKPFKTIGAAVSQIASNADNATVGYAVSIAAGIYPETIALSDTRLVNLAFIGYGVTVSGGTSAVNNNNLTDVKFVGIRFLQGTHNWTSTTTGTNFLNGNVYSVGCWFTDCWFNPASPGFTATCAGAFLFEDCAITMQMTFNNVIQVITKDSVMNQGSSYDATTNLSNPIPSGYSSTAIQYRGCSALSTSLIDAGSSLIAQWSRLRGALTINGSLTSRLCVITGAITVNSGGTFNEDGIEGHTNTLTLNGTGVYTQTGVAGTGSIILNGAKYSSGNVAPNGNIIGSIGDIYTNKSGTTSTTLWVKEAGAGTNTGWVAK